MAFGRAKKEGKKGGKKDGKKDGKNEEDASGAESSSKRKKSRLPSMKSKKNVMQEVEFGELEVAESTGKIGSSEKNEETALQRSPRSGDQETESTNAPTRTPASSRTKQSERVGGVVETAVKDDNAEDRGDDAQRHLGTGVDSAGSDDDSSSQDPTAKSAISDGRGTNDSADDTVSSKKTSLSRKLRPSPSSRSKRKGGKNGTHRRREDYRGPKPRVLPLPEDATGPSNDISSDVAPKDAKWDAVVVVAGKRLPTTVRALLAVPDSYFASAAGWALMSRGVDPLNPEANFIPSSTEYSPATTVAEGRTATQIAGVSAAEPLEIKLEFEQTGQDDSKKDIDDQKMDAQTGENDNKKEIEMDVHNQSAASVHDGKTQELEPSLQACALAQIMVDHVQFQDGSDSHGWMSGARFLSEAEAKGVDRSTAELYLGKFGSNWQHDGTTDKILSYQHCNHYCGVGYQLKNVAELDRDFFVPFIQSISGADALSSGVASGAALEHNASVLDELTSLVDGVDEFSFDHDDTFSMPSAIPELGTQNEYVTENARIEDPSRDRGVVAGEDPDTFEFSAEIMRFVLDYLQLQANKSTGQQLDEGKGPSIFAVENTTGKHSDDDRSILGLDKQTMVFLMQLVEYARYFALEKFVHVVESMLHAELPRLVMERILSNPSAVRNFSDAFLRRVDYSNLDFGQLFLNRDLPNGRHKVTSGPTQVIALRPSDFSEAVLRGADLSDCKFFGCTLRDCDLRGVGGASCNFTDADLSGANMYGANLSQSFFIRTKFDSEVNFGEATLVSAIFEDCEGLQGVSFSNAPMLSSAVFRRCDLSGCSFVGVSLQQVMIEDCNLTNSNLSGCQLNRGPGGFQPSSLENANLSHCLGLENRDFTDISLKGASLCGVSLRSTVFDGCDLNDCDLAGADLSRAVLSYCQGLAGRKLNRFNLTSVVCVAVDLTGCLLEDMDLSGSDFSECNFTSATFIRCKCDGLIAGTAIFDGATIEDCDFSKCELSFSQFGNARISNCKFTNSVLEQADFERTTLSDTDFSNANLRTSTGWVDRDCRDLILKGANLTCVDLSKARLDDMDLANTVLEDAVLSGANLTQTRLANASGERLNLSGATCKDTVFTSAILPECNMKRAKLAGSLFGAAQLVAGDFTHADLSGCNFTSAVLSSSKFEKATIENVDFSDCTLDEARGLSGRDFRTCKVNGWCTVRVDLTGAKLAGLSLERATLRESNLTRADLTGTSLLFAKLDNCRLTGAILKSSKGLAGIDFVATLGQQLSALSGADMSDNDLSGCNFEGMMLRTNKFERCKLERANFSMASLISAKMTESNLFAANLIGARCDSACFRSCNFQAAEFSSLSAKRFADYEDATQAKVKVLTGASLEGCDFRKAQLQGCDLSHLDCSNAKFDGANLSNGIFLKTKTKGASFKNAVALRAQGLSP